MKKEGRRKVKDLNVEYLSTTPIEEEGGEIKMHCRDLDEAIRNLEPFIDAIDKAIRKGDIKRQYILERKESRPFCWRCYNFPECLDPIYVKDDDIYNKKYIKKGCLTFKWHLSPDLGYPYDPKSLYEAEKKFCKSCGMNITNLPHCIKCFMKNQV